MKLKKYLKEFTLIKEREPIEVSLWNEYLMYAQIFGMADEVANQFKKLYPEVITDMDSMGYSYEDILFIHLITSDGIKSANAAGSHLRHLRIRVLLQDPFRHCKWILRAGCCTMAAESKGGTCDALLRTSARRAARLPLRAAGAAQLHRRGARRLPPTAGGKTLPGRAPACRRDRVFRPARAVLPARAGREQQREVCARCAGADLFPGKRRHGDRPVHPRQRPGRARVRPAVCV